MARDDLRAARDAYKRLHWGEAPPRELTEWEAPDPTRGPLVELGALVAVEYETTKRGDGMSVYRHTFGTKQGTRRPVLAVNGERRLIVVGGYYTVASRGIVG